MNFKDRPLDLELEGLGRSSLSEPCEPSHWTSYGSLLSHSFSICHVEMILLPAS